MYYATFIRRIYSVWCYQMMIKKKVIHFLKGYCWLDIPPHHWSVNLNSSPRKNAKYGSILYPTRVRAISAHADWAPTVNRPDHVTKHRRSRRAARSLLGIDTLRYHVKIAVAYLFRPVVDTYAQGAIVTLARPLIQPWSREFIRRSFCNNLLFHVLKRPMQILIMFVRERVPAVVPVR